MKRFLIIGLLVLPCPAWAWSIGDVVYLKSGGAPMTVTETLPNGFVGVKWSLGGALAAATLPEDSLMAANPSPAIEKKDADLRAALNPTPATPAISAQP